MRPCTCDNTNYCRLCWLYHNDPIYRLHWDASPTETYHQANKCEGCEGNVTLKAALPAIRVSGVGHIG